MTRAEQIYEDAVFQSRRKHRRMVQEFINGKRDFAPCGMDMERKAVIDAFDAAMGTAVSRPSRKAPHE